jgi:hypothetical protein
VVPFPAEGPAHSSSMQIQHSGSQVDCSKVVQQGQWSNHESTHTSQAHSIQHNCLRGARTGLPTQC